MSVMARAMLRPVVVPLLVAALVVLAAPARTPASTERDEIVPAGVWLLRGGVSVDRQDAAIDRHAGRAPLKRYLLPQVSLRAQVDGSIARTVTRAAVEGTYGMSDRWNVALELSWGEVRNDSSLEYTGGNAAQAERVKAVQADRSGLGDLRLLSLHRQVYSDRNAFLMGYGLRVPVGDARDTYTGVGGEVIDHYAPALLALLHYTRYPALGRSRFDLRLEYREPLVTTVSVPGRSGEQTLLEGRETVATVGWATELARFTVAGEGELYARTPGTLGGALQHDPVYDYTLRARLGYGNLVELEQGRPRVPYRVDLRYERTLSQIGFNTPLHNRVSLSLLTYF